MRTEVRDWVGRIVAEYKPQAPVLEVGARVVNGTVRDLFPEPYQGLDLEAGEGVDLVGDILSADLEGGWRTIVCCETLEHICEPWNAVVRMYQLLAPGGLFIGTWCCSYVIHDHPSDYFRCTPQGFRYLLETAGFYEVRVDAEAGNPPAGVWAVARKA